MRLLAPAALLASSISAELLYDYKIPDLKCPAEDFNVKFVPKETQITLSKIYQQANILSNSIRNNTQLYNFISDRLYKNLQLNRDLLADGSIILDNFDNYFIYDDQKRNYLATQIKNYFVNSFAPENGNDKQPCTDSVCVGRCFCDQLSKLELYDYNIMDVRPLQKSIQDQIFYFCQSEIYRLQNFMMYDGDLSAFDYDTVGIYRSVEFDFENCHIKSDPLSPQLDETTTMQPSSPQPTETTTMGAPSPQVPCTPTDEICLDCYANKNNPLWTQFCFKPHQEPIKFYQCDPIQERIHVKDCGPGTEWDQKLLTCNWPDMVDRSDPINQGINEC